MTVAAPVTASPPEYKGIKLQLLTNPVEILGKDGKVCGIKCVKMQLGEPDFR